MTANRHIFLNIIASYGRSRPSAISASLQSGYALVIGLFCGRWTLMALGEVDYGLMGVVGGLTTLMTGGVWGGVMIWYNT